jgi:hypothetical protein
MSIDLSTLSPKARATYIRIGRSFTSPDTQAQADRTLAALVTYSAYLADHGFGPADVQRLKDARQTLLDASIGRDQARDDKNVTSVTYTAAMKAGKACRKSAHAVLASTRRELEEAGDGPSEAKVKQIDAALKGTATAAKDARKLADQLEVLHGVLVDTTVAKVAAGRGGPKITLALAEQATALRLGAAARSGPAGTPVETETMEVLDGMVVTLARNAYKAARVAAEKCGMPAMLAAFDLSELYEARSAAKVAAAGPSNEAALPSAPAR